MSFASPWVLSCLRLEPVTYTALLKHVSFPYPCSTYKLKLNIKDSLHAVKCHITNTVFQASTLNTLYIITLYTLNVFSTKQTYVAFMHGKESQCTLTTLSSDTTSDLLCASTLLFYMFYFNRCTLLSVSLGKSHYIWVCTTSTFLVRNTMC